jgi:hypothetical protein
MPQSDSSSGSVSHHAGLVLRALRDDHRDPSACMNEARGHFQELCAGLTAKRAHAPALLASLGERMVRARAQNQALPAEAVGEMLREIVALLGRDTERAPLAPFARVSLANPSKPSNLTLRDGRRLGDVLVQLSMLTADQVEGAVRLQRATGKRLGEALMELQLLTPGMLDAALRLQQSKRALPKTAG